MKKITKPNSLKVFNDNKAMAYKKAGGEMAAFKKSLTKAQDGDAGRSKYPSKDIKRQIKNSGLAKDEYQKIMNEPIGKMNILKTGLVEPTRYQETELQDSRPKSGPLPERAATGLDYYFRGPRAAEVMANKDRKELKMREGPEFQTENNMRSDYYKKGGFVKRKKK